MLRSGQIMFLLAGAFALRSAMPAAPIHVPFSGIHTPTAVAIVWSRACSSLFRSPFGKSPWGAGLVAIVDVPAIHLQASRQRGKSQQQRSNAPATDPFA